MEFLDKEGLKHFTNKFKDDLTPIEKSENGKLSVKGLKSNIKEVIIDGKSYQKQCEGYNILADIKELNNIEKIGENRYKTLGENKDTYCRLFSNFFEPLTTYTLSFEASVVNETDWSFTLNEPGVSAFFIKNGHNVVNFTIGTAKELRITMDDSKRNPNNPCEMWNFQIVEGTEDKPYEPYNSGIKTPSPENPQEIENIQAYNLFNKDKQLDNYYYNDSGTTTIDPINKFINQELPLSKTYTISYKGKYESSGLGAYIRFLEFNGETFIKRTLININNTTINLDNATTKIIISVDCGPNAYFEELQINKGSLKPYVPYECIGVKQKGKNLLPFINQDFILSGVHYYVQDGSLYFDGNSYGEISSKNAKFKEQFNFILDAGTYIISQKKPHANAVYLYDYDNDTSAMLILGDEEQQFTLTKQTKLYIGFYTYQRVFNNINTEIMIRPSDTNNSYEPYKEINYFINLSNNFIGKLQNSQDKLIINKNGQVKLEKKVDKIILNGSENWNTNGTVGDMTRFYLQGLIQPLVVNHNAAKSNYFKGFWSYGGNYPHFYCDVSGESFFFIDTNIASTVDEFKQWLSTHNTEVCYQLKEPEIINLPSIEPIKLFEGTNNFELLTSLETNFSIEYYKYNPLTNNIMKEVLDNDFQTTDNLTTELNENSTNTQYPGAKAVFEALKNAGGGGAGIHVGPEAPTDDSEVWIDTDENGNSASGMYVGADEPIDPAIEVWIDTDEEPTVIPTKTSELENDSNFITNEEINERNFVSSSNITNIWIGTQDEYDAIEIKSETTMYYIKED